MELNLLPTEYFDFPGEGETGYSINSISKFIFPYEYINYELQDIGFVNLNIEDSKSYARREMFFWNKGKNSTDYIIEYNEEKLQIFEWMITTAIVTNSHGNEVEECLHLYKNENNIWVVKNHSYRTIQTSGEADIVEEIDVHKSTFGFVSGFRTV